MYIYIRVGKENGYVRYFVPVQKRISSGHPPGKHAVVRVRDCCRPGAAHAYI